MGAEGRHKERGAAYRQDALDLRNTCDRVRQNAANSLNTATGYIYNTPAHTRAYRLQAKFGSPIDGGTQQRDAVGDPVQDSQPVAHSADEVGGDFAAKVPKQAGEAVDPNFGERTEDGDYDEEEGQLGRAHELLQAGGDARARIPRHGAGVGRLEFGIVSLVFFVLGLT